eukprot:5756463-Pyramimonas_sp.AAC.1
MTARNEVAGHPPWVYLRRAGQPEISHVAAVVVDADGEIRVEGLEFVLRHVHVRAALRVSELVERAERAASESTGQAPKAP